MFKLSFKVSGHFESVLNNLLANLDHPHKGVSVQAAITLGHYVKKKEGVHILQPCVAKIIEVLLRLLEESEHEGIVDSMIEFVE